MPPRACYYYNERPRTRPLPPSPLRRSDWFSRHRPMLSRRRPHRAQVSRGAHGDCIMFSSDGMTCSPDADGTAADGHRRRCSGLIGCALLASEAAAHVARLCRSNPRLLSMLVQEKCGDDANSSRFAHDFKTLADVLVQRVVSKRIGRQVPTYMYNTCS